MRLIIITLALLAALATGAALALAPNLRLPRCEVGGWIGNYTGSAHLWCSWF